MNQVLKVERETSARAKWRRHFRMKRKALCVFGLAGLWVVYLYCSGRTLDIRLLSGGPTRAPDKSNIGCPFPLPNHLLREQPLQPNEGPLAESSRRLHAFLSERTSHPDIDSLSIAVVTSSGTLFEQGYGILKANETASNPVSRNSIYRIASITKMFTMLETLMLRERGALNLDEPVENLLPEIKYPSYGWSDYLNGNKVHHSETSQLRVTLRQLASHMSGVGRDYPPLDIGEWPQNAPTSSLKRMRASGDLPPDRHYQELVNSVNKYPLVNLPYDYPIYSNSGIDLLGLSNVAANKRASSHPEKEPQSHEDLIKRDIFQPLGLNSSFYHVPYGTPLTADLAIPNENHEWADFVFDDSDAPAGGQYSSLADLEAVMQSFLDPNSNNGLLSEHVIREWLHPLFTWKNGFQEVGAPWEITNLEDVRLYMKGGNLPGYHSEFALVPEYSYGVIVLMTGAYDNTAEIVHQAVSLFQSAIHNLLESRVNEVYTGHWKNASSNSGDEEFTSAEVKIINGGLYLTKLIVRGYDVLKIIEDANIDSDEPYPIALWNTGRPGEFRLAFGRKSLNNDPLAGCMPYWATIDFGLSSRGAPLDLIYWDVDELVYPSGGARFVRA